MDTDTELSQFQSRFDIPPPSIDAQTAAMMINQLYGNNLSAAATSPVTAQRMRPGLLPATGSAPPNTAAMYGGFTGAATLAHSINPATLNPAMGNNSLAYQQAGLVNGRRDQLALGIMTGLQQQARNQNVMQQDIQTMLAQNELQRNVAAQQSMGEALLARQQQRQQQHQQQIKSDNDVNMQQHNQNYQDQAWNHLNPANNPNNPGRLSAEYRRQSSGSSRSRDSIDNNRKSDYNSNRRETLGGRGHNYNTNNNHSRRSVSPVISPALQNSDDQGNTRAYENGENTETAAESCGSHEDQESPSDGNAPDMFFCKACKIPSLTKASFEFHMNTPGHAQQVYMMGSIHQKTGVLPRPGCIPGMRMPPPMGMRGPHPGMPPMHRPDFRGPPPPHMGMMGGGYGMRPHGPSGFLPMDPQSERQNALEFKRMVDRTLMQDKYCQVCSRAVSKDTLHDHKNDDEHKRKERLTRRGCILCKTGHFMSYRDYVTHIDSDYHKKNKEKLQEDLAKKSDSGISGESDEFNDKRASSGGANGIERENGGGKALPGGIGADGIDASQLGDAITADLEAMNKRNSESTYRSHAKRPHGGDEPMPAKKQALQFDDDFDPSSLVHDPDTPIGEDYIIPISGYFCKLCHKFYNDSNAAKTTHCQSQSHFDKVKQLMIQKRRQSGNPCTDKSQPEPPKNEVKPTTVAKVGVKKMTTPLSTPRAMSTPAKAPLGSTVKREPLSSRKVVKTRPPLSRSASTKKRISPGSTTTMNSAGKRTPAKTSTGKSVNLIRSKTTPSSLSGNRTFTAKKVMTPGMKKPAPVLSMNKQMKHGIGKPTSIKPTKPVQCEKDATKTNDANLAHEEEHELLGVGDLEENTMEGNAIPESFIEATENSQEEDFADDENNDNAKSNEGESILDHDDAGEVSPIQNVNENLQSRKSKDAEKIGVRPLKSTTNTRLRAVKPTISSLLRSKAK